MKMAIVNFDITLCVSSRRHQTEDIMRLINQPPTRFSAATPKALDDYRVFWDFDSGQESFDEACPTIVHWACQLADALRSIEDAAITLWCTLHTKSEFSGLVVQAAHLQSLGSHGIDLVLSAYADSNDAA